MAWRPLQGDAYPLAWPLVEPPDLAHPWHGVLVIDDVPGVGHKLLILPCKHMRAWNTGRDSDALKGTGMATLTAGLRRLEVPVLGAPKVWHVIPGRCTSRPMSIAARVASAPPSEWPARAGQLAGSAGQHEPCAQDAVRGAAFRLCLCEEPLTGNVDFEVAAADGRQGHDLPHQRQHPSLQAVGHPGLEEAPMHHGPRPQPVAAPNRRVRHPPHLARVPHVDEAPHPKTVKGSFLWRSTVGAFTGELGRSECVEAVCALCRARKQPEGRCCAEQRPHSSLP